MPVSRGLVSGAISTTPSSAASRCAPALIGNVCSVQVNLAKKYKTGKGPVPGGTKTAKAIGPPQAADACR